MFDSQPTYAYSMQTVSTVSVQERLAFLKKVYGLLTASLFSAVLGAYVGTGPLLPVVAQNSLLFMILQIGLIFFAMGVRRRPGLNMVALFSFTTVSGITLAPLLSLYLSAGAGQVVTQAFLLTALTFAGLTGYVFTSKKDFSFMGSFLITGGIIFFVGSLLNLFFHSSMGTFILSGAGVFLFSGFILYDTSNILRNYSTDEYVSATLSLYLDVLNLFIMLLNLLGMSRRD